MKPAIALTLLLFGCATAPTTWTKVDGRQATPEQQALDETACKGELQKARLANTANLGLMSQINAQHDIYAGCMAQRGYIGTRRP